MERESSRACSPPPDVSAPVAGGDAGVTRDDPVTRDDTVSRDDAGIGDDAVTEPPPRVLSVPTDAGSANDDSSLDRVIQNCVQTGEVQITCPPPPPCAGVPYAVQLGATGGNGSYVWEASAQGGLELGSTGTLSGILDEPVRWNARVRDSNGAVGGVTFELVPRQSCWFAFIDAASDPRRLSLVDPLTFEPGQAPLVLPNDLARGESVVDFQFSPSGRWLAVRVDAGGQQRLSIFEAPLWAPLGSTDASVSVERYAWAPTDPVLAFSAQSDDGAVLGGIRLAEPGVVSRLIPLDPVAAPLGSELVWFGERGIAFHSGEGQMPGNVVLFMGQVAERGPSVAQYLGASYGLTGGARLALVAGPTGLSAIFQTGSDASIDHFDTTTEPLTRTVHRPDARLAPTGATLASAEQGVLQLYRASEPRTDPIESFPVPSARGDGCQLVLAWSPEGDRVACANDAETGPALRVFQQPPRIGTEGIPAELEGLAVEGVEGYSDSLALLRRRGFSPGGHWLLYSTALELFAVDLFEPRLHPQLPGARFQSSLVATDFILSPDGEQIITHQDVWLSHHELATLAEERAVTSAPLDPPPACRENDRFASPESCGVTTSRSRQVAWSPDSRVIVFRTATSELRRARARAPEGEAALSIACDLACIEASAFQPSALPR